MDQLWKCASAYEKLLDITYKIILGRKGKLAELQISFEAVYFHHLMGLHKLTDLRISRANRQKIFQDILMGKISYDSIAQSRYFSEIECRFHPFLSLESLLYFCRSFFPKGQHDYTKGQTIYTMLYKEKIFLHKGYSEVQYDRLTPKSIASNNP